MFDGICAGQYEAYRIATTVSYCRSEAGYDFVIMVSHGNLPVNPKSCSSPFSLAVVTAVLLMLIRCDPQIVNRKTVTYVDVIHYENEENRRHKAHVEFSN